MKLRIGLLGLGAMGLSHLHALRKLCSDQVAITALCDTNETNLQAARDVVPAAKAFQTPDELIKTPLDAIVVSTPNFTHARLAEEILAAGKHLFLEKPGATCWAWAGLPM